MADTRMRISGGAVRFGATYGGNRLFSGARGTGGSNTALSRSLGLARGAGAGLGLGAGLGMGVGIGGNLGLGAGAALAGLGLGGGLSLAAAGGSRTVGFRAGVAPLRARLGGRVFKIGGYGFNPSFLSSTTSAEAGISPVPIIDPSLPSLDTVQVTRLREKEELQALNDKFASFIDKVSYKLLFKQIFGILIFGLQYVCHLGLELLLVSDKNTNIACAFVSDTCFPCEIPPEL